MAFAPPVKAKLSTNLAKSTWTPMNHPEANLQVFEERREIIQKWFQKWQDTQKRLIVNDILKNLSNKHLVSLHETLNAKFPQERHDFTRILPRVLTLYLFSFLDPRTLCRCAQVSWYWNYLTEMDCLWRPKCLKFGWYPTYQPSPFEEKIWKRFYVNTVHELNFAKIKSTEVKHSADDDGRLDTARSNMSKLSVARSTTSSVTGLKKGPSVPSTKKPLSAPKWQPPPWKGSDPHPTDTNRYNYLDNRKKKKGSSSGSRPSSKQGGRPQSALDRSRHNDHDDVSLTSSRRLSRDAVDGSYNPALDKAAHLSASKLATYAGGGTLASPRLNKDFQLPQYNGHDSVTSGHVVTSSNTMKNNLQQSSGYPNITSQINWNPQNTRNSLNLSTNQMSLDRPSSSQGRRRSSKQDENSRSLTEDLVKKSMDAGVRPQPVAKFTPEKPKQRSNTSEVDRGSHPTNPPEHGYPSTTKPQDLKGKAWKVPENSNSDDEF